MRFLAVCAARNDPLRLRASHVRVSDRAADDDQVPFDSIHAGDAGKKSPALEAQFFEEPQTRLVVGENAADQSGDSQSGSLRDGLVQECPPHAPPASALADVNTHLRGGSISGTRDERMKTEPARDLVSVFGHPERMRFGRMLAEPRQSLRDCYRLQLCRGDSAADSRIVDFDDGRKISFPGLADDHAARIVLSGAGVVWKKIWSNVG